MAQTDPPIPWRIGLHAGSNPEELIFALPGMSDDELRFIIDTGRAIISIDLEKILKKAIRRISAVGNRSIDAYEVLGIDLFDDAMAAMLDTVADGSAIVADGYTIEAARLLRETMAELTPEKKMELRGRAVQQLHAAYRGYKTSIEIRTEQDAAEPASRLIVRRRLTLPENLDRWDKLIDLHAKAASREIAIALINRHMGLAATQTRVDSALEHFLNHYRLRIIRAADTIYEVIKLATEYRMGGVAQNDMLDLSLGNVQTIDEADRLIDSLKAIGSRHIAATRGWDGEARTIRHMIAFCYMDAVPAFDRDSRMKIYKQSLDQVQAVIDDLKSVQQCQRSFAVLAHELKALDAPTDAPSLADNGNRCAEKMAESVV